MSFVRDPGVAFHSLVRSKGFAAIVVLTLALGIGANAAVAAVILAFVPRRPSANASNGMNLASGSVRITSSRQRIFAVTQIAASFVLLAGASMLITTLIALQTTLQKCLRRTV